MINKMSKKFIVAFRKLLQVFVKKSTYIRSRFFYLAKFRVLRRLNCNKQFKRNYSKLLHNLQFKSSAVAKIAYRRLLRKEVQPYFKSGVRYLNFVL